MNKILKKLFIYCLLWVIVLGSNLYSQTSYDDVLLVINANSGISDSIGSYFASVRSIPPGNIARINVSTSEEIHRSQFDTLRAQLEQFILSNNLADKINYIVTTKGVPLKVDRGNVNSNMTYSASSSVESELQLILGPYASNIGQAGFIYSPYANADENFSHARYGFYLTTRLDGYSYSEMKGMIDRATTPTLVMPGMQFVFDEDPEWNSTLANMNQSLADAAAIIHGKGLTSLLDTTEVFLTHQSSIIGYASWGSNDHEWKHYTQFARPHDTWAPGAIAETFVSSSGRTFTQPVSYGQSVIADLIHEGVSGAKGYVFEPFSLAMANVPVLFDRYTKGYTMVESYAMASLTLSWMDVIIGDPKMKIVLPRTTVASLSAQVDTILDVVHLNWTTSMEFRNKKFMVDRRMVDTTVSPQSWSCIDSLDGSGTVFQPVDYSCTDAHPADMTYSYRLTMVDSAGVVTYSDSVTVTKSASAPLPIQLATFYGEASAKSSVKLTWTTLSETNDYGFYVERSCHGSSRYTTVSGLIPGAGTSLDGHQYVWTDDAAPSGECRYRIRQVDLNGSFHFSPEIRIVVEGVLAVQEESVPKIFMLMQNYPNPFNPTTTVTFTLERTEHVSVRVYSMLGTEVALLFDGTAGPGRYYRLSFDASSLSSGEYIYRITTDSRTTEKKMVVIK